MDMSAINEKVIRDHRAGGEIGVKGMHRERIVLLTTIGRTSGERHTAPMMFLRTDEGVYVVASNAGDPHIPQWYLNIEDDPRVHVELPDAEWDGRARVLAGDERDTAWERILRDAPFFADHAEKAGRELPVVELLPEAS